MRVLDKMLRRMNSWLMRPFGPTIVTKSQQPTIALSLSPSKHRPWAMIGGRLQAECYVGGRRQKRRGMHVAPAHLLSTCLLQSLARRMRSGRYEFIYVLQP